METVQVPQRLGVQSRDPTARQTQVTRQVTQTPWASACPSVKWEDDSTYHTAVRAFNVFRYIKHLERCWVHSRCSVNITYCS